LKYSVNVCCRKPLVTKPFHKKYSLTAVWEYVIYMHINLKIILDPYSQQLSMGRLTSSTPLTEGYMWSRLGPGQRKTISFVLNWLIIILLSSARWMTCLISSASSTSVFSGTSRLVSSVYFKSKLTADLGWRSHSITRYKVGPRPDSHVC